MKTVILGFVLMVASVAFAGFQGYDGSQDLKLFNVIKCGPGVNCSKEKDKFLIETGEQDQIASTASLTLVSSQCGDTVKLANTVGSHTATLPAATGVQGCRFTFTTTAVSGANYVDVAAGDQIYGLTNAVGDRISNNAVGNSVILESVGVSGWNPVSIYGTWSDAN